MFNFFSKKRYLPDYLENFVDIHNHILPGIDDGAKTVRDSIDLIKGLGEFGIRKFIATPHILGDLYPNTPETIKEAHALLMEHLMDHMITDIAIEPAAEHMIDIRFEELLSQDMTMPLRRRFILVEMSFLQPSLNFEACILQISAKGLTPILAHPERYQYFNSPSRQIRAYAGKGIAMQVNLLSLGEYYGTDVQKTAYRLLEEDLVDFVATDAHHKRHIDALKEITIPGKYHQKLEAVIRNTLEVLY